MALWFAVSRRAAATLDIGLHRGILALVGFTWALLAYGLTMVGLYAAFAPATEPFTSDSRTKSGLTT